MPLSNHRPPRSRLTPWLSFGRRVGWILALAATMAARCGPKNDCPLQVRRIFLSGRAPQVIVKNRAAYPIGHIVFHVAYEDLFSKYNELTVDVDTIVGPGERVTLGLQPITTSVEWETVQVYAMCQRADVDRPSDGAPAPKQSLPDSMAQGHAAVWSASAGTSG